MAVLGIDLSHHNDDNGTINFDALAGHVDYVITKVTQGISYVDPTATRHIAESRRIGVIPGLYHFPNWGDPIAEADFFCRNAGDVTGAFVAFDCENIPAGVGPVNWTYQWLQRVSSTLGVAALVYMNKSTLNGYDWTPVINGGFGLWLANYDGNPGDFSVTGAWSCVALKQYSDAGHIDGVTGNVDLDSFNGSVDQLRKYCKVSAPAPVVVPAPQPAPVAPWTVLPSMSYGQRSGSVASLQSFLARVFPSYAATCGNLPATGLYGDITVKWVREFQSRCGIRSNGKDIGPLTKPYLWRYGWRG